MEMFLRVLDQAIQNEVSMEQMRQKLQERKEFDVSAAFLTMAAAQRSDDPYARVKMLSVCDLQKLMINHEQISNL